MRQVPRQLGIYLSRIGWIARDGFRRSPGRIVVVSLLSLLGILAATSTLAGVLLYAQTLERGRTSLEIGGWRLELVGNDAVFYIYAAALMGLGIISGALLYIAEWQISRITVAYQQALTRRLLKIAADPQCAGWQHLLRGEPRQALSRLAGLGVKLTAFAFRNMLRAILPLLTAVVALIVLLAIDWRLTLLLGPVALLYLVPLYLINRGVARQHRQYMELSPQARGLAAAALRDVVDSTISDAQRDRIARQALDAPVHDEAAELFWKRKLATFRVQLVNTTFFVICLIALFVYFGIATRDGGRTWSEFLGYVIALRFLIAAVRRVTARFIKLSRFLPEYHRYINFVDDARAVRDARQRRARQDRQPFEGSFTLRTGGERRWDSPARLSIAEGATLWIITARRITHATLQAIATRLEEKSRGDIDLISHTRFAAEGSNSDADAATPIIFASADALDEQLHHERGIMLTAIVTDDPGLPLHDDFAVATSENDRVIVLEDRAIIAAGDIPWLRANQDAVREAIDAMRRGGPDEGEDDADLELEAEDDD